MSFKIKEVIPQIFKIPLDEVLSDAKHGDHTHFDLITVKVILENGMEGVGYTYTGGRGGSAVYHMIKDDLAPHIIGMDAQCYEQIWDSMNWFVHYVGRGGIVSFAVSAIDIALWDIKCKAMSTPLWKVLGGNDNSTLCYAGGIDLDFPLEKLLGNIQGYMDAGHTAVKIKLGQENPQVDLDRVKAVRELIGPNKVFMVDANMKWSPEQAIRMTRELAKYDILWLEEPTIPDDYLAYARIGSEGALPIAMGENLHTIFEFRYAMEIGKISFAQPDASNIGGITGWLKVAAMTQAFNIPICTHGMQELHVSMMSAMPNASYLEVHSFPIDKYTKRPLVVKNGRAYAPDNPGVGVEFLWDVLAEYDVSCGMQESSAACL